MHSFSDEKADLIIIGAGIFGSSIAYYYKREFPGKKVIVYENNEICSGNTSIAAALLSRIRDDEHVVPLSLETYRIIPELEKINGEPVFIQKNGSIHLAVNTITAESFDKLKTIANKYKIECNEINQEKAKKMAPWLSASFATRILHFPDEAITDPYLLCTAFANAAKKLGVNFKRKKKVNGLIRSGNQVIGIITDSGVHHADNVILAAGVWSIVLAEKIGIRLPMAPVRSQYWITQAKGSLFATSPTVLIPEVKFYARPFGKSLLFGIREEQSKYKDPRELPDCIADYNFNDASGWNDLEENYKSISPFFPAIEDTGIKKYIAGYSGYTPDNQFIFGEVPQMKGLFLATGCVGAGISVAGGVGLGLASLAGGKKHPFDFSHYKVDRFGNIDPYSPIHLASCAAARSKKKCG